MSDNFKQREETYLGEYAMYERPKEITKRLAHLVAERTDSPRSSLLDVGCATGELLHHFRQRFPEFRLAGLDNAHNLLTQARSVPGLAGVRLEHGDALTFSCDSFGFGPFDFVVCSGVLSIFDDFVPLMENLIRNVRPGGTIFVVSMFNDDDIDVRIRYRDNRHDPERWQGGFEVHSTATCERWLRGRVASLRFIPFEMPFDVQKRETFPHRAWSLATADGRRLMINGLCLICYEQILEVVV